MSDDAAWYGSTLNGEPLKKFVTGASMNGTFYPIAEFDTWPEALKRWIDGKLLSSEVADQPPFTFSADWVEVDGAPVACVD